MNECEEVHGGADRSGNTVNVNYPVFPDDPQPTLRPSVLCASVQNHVYSMFYCLTAVVSEYVLRILNLETLTEHISC